MSKQVELKLPKSGDSNLISKKGCINNHLTVIDKMKRFKIMTIKEDS